MPRSERDTGFADFVGERRTDLVRFATLCSGDAHRAEDLVQTALAKLYVAWPRVIRSGSPVGYTRRIIVNAHIDETRRPFWRHERAVPEPPDRPDPAPFGPDEGLGGAVRRALAELPPGMRAAVVLRHWLDLGVEETAELMGVSAGTVKSQTAKGVARLKALLEPTTGDAVTADDHIADTGRIR